jgi:hypothetical protein
MNSSDLRIVEEGDRPVEWRRRATDTRMGQKGDWEKWTVEKISLELCGAAPASFLGLRFAALLSRLLT